MTRTNRLLLAAACAAGLLLAGFALGRWSARRSVETAYGLGLQQGGLAAWEKVEASRASLIADRDRFRQQAREARRYEVVHIVDGDTLDIRDANGIVTRIRLMGIDTPERGEPGFDEATAALAELAEGKWVTVLPQHKDRWQRTVALVFIEGGPELAETMLDQFPQWEAPSTTAP